MDEDNWHSKLYLAFDDDPRPAVAFLQWLATSYHLPDDLSLLDVGAGPGRFFDLYAELAWQVTALEPHEAFFRRAQQRARELPNVRVVRRHFASIDYREQFHLITAINGVFAYLLAEEERREALQRVFRALKPGGVVFLDVPNLLWFLRHEPEWASRRANIAGMTAVLCRRYTFDYHEARFTQENEYILTRPDGREERFTASHEHTILLYPQVAQLLHAVGFTDLRTYNSYEARDVQRLDASRIMVAARRP